MQNSDARIVRGVSIAVVVLSVLAILGFLFGAISVGVFGAFAADPSLYGDGISAHGYDHGYYDSMSAEGVAGLVSFSLWIATAALAWCTLCAAGTLVAGVLGMRNYDKPEKLGSAFGWAIAGAVVALLSGRLITMILLIVAAVYINKVRNPAPNAYAQPAYAPQGYAPQGYAQPMPQAPVYGQQPYAPQPTGYQQPAPATPLQQDAPQPQASTPATAANDPQPQAPAPQTPPDQQ